MVHVGSRMLYSISIVLQWNSSVMVTEKSLAVIERERERERWLAA